MRLSLRHRFSLTKAQPFSKVKLSIIRHSSKKRSRNNRINFINGMITTLSFPRSLSPTRSESGNLSGIKEE